MKNIAPFVESPSLKSLNEEVIAETEAYFKIKNESSYQTEVEKLEKCRNECITLEWNYVVESRQISRKNCFFFS